MKKIFKFLVAILIGIVIPLASAQALVCLVQSGCTGVGSITGVIVGNGINHFTSAVSGTDIKTINSTSLLGSGNFSLVDSSLLGANNGVATLDSGGKINIGQLPSTIMNYRGAWNATTNTPTLVDGTGTNGDVWLTTVAGTQNLGSGSITFAAGDWVVYNGTVWQKSINSNAVVSVNGQQGVVSLNTDNISEGATNLYFTNARAQSALSGLYEVPLTFSSPLSRATNTISIPAANGSTNGYLSSTDWGTFNGKVSSQWTTSGSYLYYNTGNVGIGTTAPTNILSLTGTKAQTIWMERNTTAATAGQGLTLSSGGAIAGTADLAGGDLTLKSGISTGLGSSALHFLTATAGVTGTADNIPTEKMTLLGNGNLGIGTTTPAQKLEVAGGVLQDTFTASGATGYGLQVNAPTGATTNYAASFMGGNIGIGTTAPVSKLTLAGGNFITPSADSASAIGFASYASPTTPILSVDTTNGRIGIGTTAPTANLQVAQNTTGVGTITTTATGTTVTGAGTQFTNTFKVGDTITANAETHTISAIASNTSMTTDAWTNANSGIAYTLVGGARFSVLGNGNIGIGTTAPGSKLVIQGATSDSTLAGLNVTNSGTTSLLYVRNDGNIGIGTTAPAQKLEVAGGVLQDTFTASGTNAYGLQINAPTGATNNYSATFMGGNIGIGTTAPGQALDVNGQITSNNKISTTLGTGLALQVLGTNSNFNIITDSTSKVQILNSIGGGSYSFRDAANANDLFLLTQSVASFSGNVGIGTTAPASPLTVAGQATSNAGQIALANATGGSPTVYMGVEAAAGGIVTGSSVGDFSLDLGSAHNINFTTNNGTPQLVIQTGGNVGIGTTGPGEKLDVAGSVKETSIKTASTQTTVSCSTSGTVVFSEPNQGTSYKNVIVYANACVGTASYTFPTAFTNTPDAIGADMAEITTISTTAITFTGTTTTGFSQIYGY